MKTKYFLTSLVLLFTTVALQAQTMRWLPTPPKSDFGKCSDASTKSGLTQCYVLEYTPAVSGVLTSYTTGFMVSCTSLGSAIAKNQSCGMNANTNVVNGCEGIGKVLMNSSGNSGTLTHNQIQAGVPVILHQVCLTIPTGETVTIEEDPVTDLTTSVDLGNGSFSTEFPVFQPATFRRIRYDDATHTAFLDFQGMAAGNFVTQLDWTTRHETDGTMYRIERSFDGELYEQIGEMPGLQEGRQINTYQFFDEKARPGSNYYRLLQTDTEGKTSYSPVREIVFQEHAFSVSASPNPAREKLFVKIGHAREPGTIKLLDVSGKERLVSLFELTQSNLTIELNALEEGMYTLQVISGKDTYVEKIVVLK